MGLLNMTPQRESRLKMALSESRHALALQLIETLKTNPIGVHITLSQVISLCQSYDSIGSIIAHLTKHKEHFSLSGIGKLCQEEIVDMHHVNSAYLQARHLLARYNNRHPRKVEEIIRDIENTPTCWEFICYTEVISWQTSDVVVIQNKNLGKYKACLALHKWEWTIFSTDNRRSSYPHPHVSDDGYPCYGNAAGLMTAEKGIVKNLEGLWAFLHQYNESSAYAKLYTF